MPLAPIAHPTNTKTPGGNKPAKHVPSKAKNPMPNTPPVPSRLGPPRPTVATRNTSMTRPATKTNGHVFHVQLERHALVTLLGRMFCLNLDGQDATTTMLPLNVVLFPRRVWVVKTPLWWASTWRKRLIWPTATTATALQVATPRTSMPHSCVANARTTTATTVFLVVVTVVLR